MFNRRSVVTACGAAIAVLVITAAASGNAMFSSQSNTLTFTGPVALPGVSLVGGTYIFERLSPTSPNIVRVLSNDRSRVYYQAFTAPVMRPQGMPAGRTVAFGEAQAGAPTPIVAWYPINSATGYRFIYETH